jgi:glycosyltransferase involved in cell wall biosynthesis
MPIYSDIKSPAYGDTEISSYADTGFLLRKATVNIKVLHTLSQRPQQTGSGITLDELIRHGSKALYNQEVIVGVPFDSPFPTVGGLSPSAVNVVKFGKPPLNFPVPGMSDVMPYESTRWSTVTKAQLETYKKIWSQELEACVNRFKPSLIHTNHIWILSSLMKKLFPSIPVMAHCHATGLRQMELCPHLKNEVIEGCKTIDAFAVLHRDHKTKLAGICGVALSKIHVVGAGYNPNIFKIDQMKFKKSGFPNQNHAGGSYDNKVIHVAYAGKYSLSKGLASLLDAVELVNKDKKKIVLHVAGSGSGSEADKLKERMIAMADQVVLYGQVDQWGLAEIFNKCSVFALTSFYEGLPLVLIEALSCGCRIVCTKLPGIINELVPFLAEYMDLVDLPAMKTIDEPFEDGLPNFAEDIGAAIIKSSAKASPADKDGLNELKNALNRFTWHGVFERVEEIWKSLLTAQFTTDKEIHPAANEVRRAAK